jgi:tetratricopeptide (TPR) repeat protein
LFKLAENKDTAGYVAEAIASNFDKLPENVQTLLKKLKPNNVEGWVMKGYALHNLQRYDEAIASYDKAIEINPNDADAWHNKGTALDELGKYNEAIACYDKAIEINPDSLDIKANLAEALLISKDYSKSERLAKEVIDKTDDKILVYIMRLLIVCSLYVRGSMDEGRKETLDLLNYFESIPIDSEYDWSFDNLKEMINYDSRLSKDEKEILSLLISLPKTKEADYRLKYINKIRNLIE